LLHEYFCCYLDLLVSQQNAEEFRRFQQREQLNRQVAETALRELTEVLHPRKTALSEEGAPLLITAGAVGKAQSITVNPPAGSEDLSRVKDPMEAIARSSQFRTRRVLLVGDWWRQNSGPLLAYTKSDNQPVALLPGKGDRYTLFDPIDRTRKRVTKAIALAVNQIRAQLSGATQRTLLNAIFSLLNLGLMFIYNLPLALVGIGLTLIAVIVTVTSSLLLIQKERKMETGDGDINGLTVELINGVSKLRVAAAEGRAFAAWAKKYSQQIKLRTGIKRIDDSVSVFNEALPLVSSILMFWFAIQFMENHKTGGDVLNSETPDPSRCALRTLLDLDLVYF
jgi:ABC-type multidrug transport system fused ATPase/permease subunit